jgi:uroporphyrinogen-III synthase
MMRVLVLRPEPQAGRTASALADRGFETVVAPMLDIVLEPGVVDRVRAPGRPEPDVLVFTSAHGVEAVRADPRLGEIVGHAVHVVGPATEEAAREAGFTRVHRSGGDGAALVEDLARTLPADAVVVHVAGRDRSVHVAEALAAAGRRAFTVEAYRAEVSQVLPERVARDLAEGRLDIAVVASRRTAEGFRAALADLGLPLPLARPALVALSPSAAEPLRDALAVVTVADRPDGDALTEGVVALAATLANNEPSDRSSTDRPHAGEEPEIMPPEHRDGAGDTGRRKGRGRSTTIDLTAREVRAAADAAAAESPAPPADAETAPETAAVTSPETEVSAAAAAEPGTSATDTMAAGEAPAGEAAAGSAQAEHGQPPVTDETATAPPSANDAGPEQDAAAPLRPAAPTSGPRAGATEPTRDADRRGGLGTLAAAVVGGLVVLAGAAGLVATGAIPTGGGADPATSEAIRALDARVSAVDGRLQDLPPADLAARLASLEAAVAERPAVSGPDLSGEIAALSARIDALPTAPAAAAVDLGPVEQRLDAVGTEIETLKAEAAAGATLTQRLDALEAAVGDLRTAVETARADLSAVIGRLRSDRAAAGEAAGARDAAIAGATTRIDEIVSRLDAGPKGGEIAALSLAVTSLASRVAAGEPYAADLDLVRAAAPDAEGLDVLSEGAATGVPTVEALAARFPARAILAARLPQADGAIVDRLFAGAKSLVNYRETDAATADPVSAGVTAIEAALAAADVSAAKAAADALPAEARAADPAWFADLDRRAAVDAVLAALTDRILTRLQAPAEGQ